ncbi:MAG: hypothetical protein QGH46_05170, partial [Gammaproteobacteria bacterium]|nr:hypothetical protein [Gammaproteobacteria bacterium]
VFVIALVAFLYTFIPVVYLGLLVVFFGLGTAFFVGVAIIVNTSDPDRNFGFVITTQVLFGVVALASFPFLVGQFNSIGGMYVPLGGVALIGLLFVKHIPEGPAQQEMAGGDSATGSLALPVTALVVMLIWCCGLGAMWGALGDIAIAGGLELEIVGVSVSISSAVAMTGSLAAATLAAKGVNRFLPMTIALLVQIAMAWLLQGEMSFPELVIKASIFQIFWNMTGPFLMGAIAASDTSGRVSVLIPAAQTTGFFVGPVAVAIASGIFAEAGLVVANYLTVLFCAIALIIFIPLSARLKAAGY